MLQPVILSGGSGTRLWPLSREHYPKQLLCFAGERTLLQETALRAGLSAEEVAAPLIVCNEEHRFLVAEQLRELGTAPAGIILEPAGRNTAPALTLAALAIAQQDGDPVMLVMPADHVVRDAQAFAAAVAEAVTLAEAGYLVTFGIVPAGPETGYGYIKVGGPLATGGAARELAAFVEKPDLATAQGYVASGDYLWNSGMFFFLASRILEAIDQHLPGLGVELQRYDEAARAGTEAESIKATYAQLPAVSIDHGIMEKVSAVSVVPGSFEWSDLGSWTSAWELSPRDGHGNVLPEDGIAADASGNYVSAPEGKLVVLVGVHDLVVVDAGDALLVVPKNRAQEVRVVVASLRDRDDARR